MRLTKGGIYHATEVSAGCWSQSDREVPPVRGVGTFGQEPGNASDDWAELVMPERPDQDAAGVVATGFGPLAQQWSEITGVARDEDAVLFGGEFQYLGIVERAEGRVGREAENVVTLLREGSTDPFR